MRDLDKLSLLESVILSKKSLLRDHKLIGFFGSCLYSKNFFDIDLVTISKNKAHQQLMREIKNDLLKQGIKAIFFNTVKKQPLSKKENEVLIHDLHYSNLRDLYKREWKDVINEIRSSMRVVYGSKNKIKKITVNKQDFYSLWLNWCKKITNNGDYIRFRKYLQKVIPKVYRIHPKLGLRDEGDKILEVIASENWRNAKKEIIKLLTT